jgi:hypothetical protein
MAPSVIQLEVLRPQYLKYVLGATVDAWFGSSELLGKGPRVVAINDRGQEVVVAQYRTIRQASEARTVMQDELYRLGYAGWCEKHDMPASFLDT